jgi:hypothetical protein
MGGYGGVGPALPLDAGRELAGDIREKGEAGRLTMKGGLRDLLFSLLSDDEDERGDCWWGEPECGD